MYIAFEFRIHPLQPASDMLLAELAFSGFESFVETDTGLTAYIRESEWKEGMLEGIRVLQQPEYSISCTRTRVEQQNWNAAWEQSFQPIRIGEECMVRAPFHKPENTAYDIVIEPKMSFGTGHHETTYMMLQWLLELEVTGKRVLDMGCGTGVLAILAAMRGAGSVDAIDIDPWCYANSLENIQRNGQDRIRVIEGDVSLLGGASYDLILANINRNILLSDIPVYARTLTGNGILLVSGFYLGDLDAISEKCREVNLKFEKNLVKNNWVSAKYVF